jgi:hypothetical protein
MNRKYLVGFLSAIILLSSIAYVANPSTVFAAPNSALETTVTVNDDVFAVAVTSTKIYIGGNFTQVNGEARNYIAALNLDGTLDTAWDPDVDDTVLAIYANDTTVYAGGNFGTVNATATTRSRAAAFPIANGVNTGTATAWDPELNGNVLAIAGSGTKIYLGGEFTDVNAGTTRNGIAAVNSTTGAVDAAWNPNLGGAVEEMLINDSKVYAVGTFDFVNGLTPRGYGAAFNLADGADVGTALAWNPATNGDVDDISFYNDQIYTVGEFTQVGAEVISYAARVDPTTGAIDNTWDPQADGNIFAISISDDGNIFLGGAFNNIGVDAHKWVGLVNSSDGAVSSWDPVLRAVVQDTVFDLGLSETTIAVGGDFGTVNSDNAHANFAQFEFPEVEFTASSASGLESVTAVNIEVSLDFASDLDTTVDYAVTGGTATGAGTDYTLASGTATILSTETTVDIATTVVSDLTDEVNETIIITLSNPTNAFLGTNTTHTYTITDDDEAVSADSSSSGSRTISSDTHSLGTIINIDGTLYTITKNDQGQIVRRPYTSPGAFLSYGFNSFNIVVEATEADKKLSVGDFIPPQDGRVVCSDRGLDQGTCYLITKKQKAGFVSETVFTDSGFSFKNVLFGDISFLPKTSNIETASQAHLPGTIIVNNNTIQLVSSSSLLGFSSLETFLSWGYDLNMIVPANSFDTLLTQNSVVVPRQADQIMISY